MDSCLIFDDFDNAKPGMAIARRDWINIVVIIFDIIALGSCYILSAGGNLLENILASLILALVYFHNFSLFHECVHGICARGKKLNTVIGHYAGFFCMLPFYPWRDLHMLHHKFAGNLEDDPVLINWRNWQLAGKVPDVVRWCWKCWIPVPALMQHMVFLLYPLRLLNRRKAGEPVNLKYWCSIIIFIVSTIVLTVGVSVLIGPWIFLSSLLIYLVIEEFVNLPHHVAMPTHTSVLSFREQYQVTRTCYFKKYLAECLFLNFNFHIEHHLFPSLPWYQLRHAHHLNRKRLGEKYNLEYGVNWSIKNRKIDLDKLLFISKP